MNFGSTSCFQSCTALVPEIQDYLACGARSLFNRIVAIRRAIHCVELSDLVDGRRSILAYEPTEVSMVVGTNVGTCLCFARLFY